MFYSLLSAKAFPNFLERSRDRRLNFSRAITAEFLIHIFQSADKINDFLARIYDQPQLKIFFSAANERSFSFCVPMEMRIHSGN